MNTIPLLVTLPVVCVGLPVLLDLYLRLRLWLIWGSLRKELLLDEAEAERLAQLMKDHGAKLKQRMRDELTKLNELRFKKIDAAFPREHPPVDESRKDAAPKKEWPPARKPGRERW
jgi:hypothetical protein